MLVITTDDNSISLTRGDITSSMAKNTLDYDIVNYDTVIFKYSGKKQTIDSALFENFTLNGETLTIENADEKLKAALFI